MNWIQIGQDFYRKKILLAFLRFTEVLVPKIEYFHQLRVENYAGVNLEKKLAREDLRPPRFQVRRFSMWLAMTLKFMFCFAKRPLVYWTGKFSRIFPNASNCLNYENNPKKCDTEKFCRFYWPLTVHKKIKIRFFFK